MRNAFVFSNLAISLDGKIATASREVFHLGTPADRKQMQVLRKGSDAVIMGASTLRAHRKYCPVFGAKRQPANVIVSTGLEGVSADWPFFSYEGGRRILVLTKPVSPARLRRFEASCEIIPVKPTRSAPLARQVIRELQGRGMHRLLVEGGGGLMWDFARDNLIDEYHVTVTPRILGGTEAPTLVDGLGFSPAESLNLHLVRSRKLGDELYLTYRKTDRRGP